MKRILITLLLCIELLIVGIGQQGCSSTSGVTQFSLPCGTKRAMYKNETTTTQRFTFRISSTGGCHNFKVYCGSPLTPTLVGGVILSPGETNDALCELSPNDIVDIDCPGNSGNCELEWRLDVSSSWAVTTRICGIDNDIFANGTSTAEKVKYEIHNDGACGMLVVCNGVPFVPPGGAVPINIPPGGGAFIDCTVNAGSVLTVRCAAGRGDCVARYKRIP